MCDEFEAFSGIGGDLFPELDENYRQQLPGEALESEDFEDGRNIGDQGGNLETRNESFNKSQSDIYSKYIAAKTEHTTHQRRSRKQSLEERNFDCLPPSTSERPGTFEAEKSTVVPIWMKDPNKASSPEEKKQILHAIKSRNDRVRKQKEKAQLINTIKERDCHIERLASTVKNMQDTVENIRLENAKLWQANGTLEKAIHSLMKDQPDVKVTPF